MSSRLSLIVQLHGGIRYLKLYIYIYDFDPISKLFVGRIFKRITDPSSPSYCLCPRNADQDMFETFPPKLTELVLDDEWNKAVGRIPPMVAAWMEALLRVSESIALGHFGRVSLIHTWGNRF